MYFQIPHCNACTIFAIPQAMSERLFIQSLVNRILLYFGIFSQSHRRNIFHCNFNLHSFFSRNALAFFAQFFMGLLDLLGEKYIYICVHCEGINLLRFKLQFRNIIFLKRTFFILL